MKTHLLTVRPDGTAVRLHSEAPFLSQELGTVIGNERLSNVEFNVETQQWEVHLLPPGPCTRPPAFTHPSRQACLDWEHANLTPDKYHA